MRLSQLIQHAACKPCQWSDADISAVTFDSRDVHPGTLFVAQTGTRVDGHDYIGQAVASGAAAIVCQRLPEQLAPDVVYLVTDNSSRMLGEVASAFYGHPSRKLKLVGITGTNGKTTTATLLHSLFRRRGDHAGLLSTIVNKIDDVELPASHTTPDAVELNALLARMVAAGCSYCFMEVSSHAVVQQRIAGLVFSGGVFSNLTHDHLDFHKTMAAYIAAKKGFFDALPADAFALVNIDDRNGHVMIQNTAAHCYTYSLRQVADFRCRLIDSAFSGLHLQLDGVETWCRLVGRFNAYNLTAIYAAAVLCGVDRDEARLLLSGLDAAAGRFSMVQGNGLNAVIDYAHTPDALDNVISTVNDIRQPAQTLITVVGCGGDRDKTKRPEMARIAVRGSGRVILTSDNPRSEDPESILDDMEAGLSPDERQRVLRIADRRSALRAAVMMAQPGDIILVAGKGHETYQEVSGVRHHFDDREEMQKLLKTQS
ncbi:MAG: UDP-N-acetylmuramyl tripeptide synthetase [bacterium P3]|nr:MAG: UDP-N-acetylmuramyl tripeptide synthetase [bacterium P3]KWW40506.1 MAG: UDP-N-acetylmuramyl tripeptide synthetase [bacterium F083]